MYLSYVQALMPVLEVTLLLGQRLLMDLIFDWHSMTLVLCSTITANNTNCNRLGVNGILSANNAWGS